MKMMNSPVYIAGAGVVSPLGIGFSEFRAGLFQPEKVAAQADRSFAGNHLPDTPALVLDAFDVRTYLGKKGVSSLDRTTQLSILASGLALKHAGIAVTSENERELGVILGTATGSIKSIADFTQSTYTNDPPYMVSAVAFPNTVMNCAAGQCAIWHKLKGVNSTLCAGGMSSLLALRYAALMLRLGHAKTLLAGGVEEYCDFTAWAHRALHPQPHEEPLGEGCAMFALTMDDTLPRLGTLLSCQVASCPPVTQHPEQFEAALERCIFRAIEQAGIHPTQLSWWVRQQSAKSGLGTIEQKIVRRVVNASLEEISHGHRVAETYSARTAFQLMCALASGVGGVGLLTSCSGSGMVGCSLVEIESTAQ